MKKKEIKKTIVKQNMDNKELPKMSEDFKQIHDLVKLVTENNLSEISFEKGDYKLTVKQKSETVVTTPSYPVSAPTTPIVNKPVVAENKKEEKSVAKENSNLITIKSPMIGTFYLKPSPDKPAFVEVGSEVSKGKVLCLVEAMKLFNEIESDVDGKIVKILVENSSPVEYDQPLFLVEPK